MKPRWVFELTGTALLLLLPFSAQLLYPGGTYLLHNPRSLSSIILGIGIDAVAVFLVGWVIFLRVPRLEPPFRALAVAFLSGTVIWWSATAILIFLSLLPPVGIMAHLEPALDRSQTILLGLNFSIPMFATVLVLLRPNAVFALARGLRLGLASFSTCALWVVPNLVYLAFLHPVPGADHSAALPEPGPSQRVVWVMLDELSHDLVFDHPIPGATYPNLAAFRRQSVTFTNVLPSGSKTEMVIPALLAGIRLEGIKSSMNGDLLTEDPVQHQWHPYDPANTLFGLAQANGWNPGVSGWYNPYCRIFHSVLTACTWAPGIQDMLPIQRIGASHHKSPLANSFVIPRFFFRLFFGETRTLKTGLLDQNRRDFTNILEQGQKLIANDKIHFVFLHLPVPHPPGIYNRTTHQLCSCGNYFDNLTLADDTLGRLLQQIRNTPDAAHTTVIVSSDHSWRVPIWKGGQFWTPEEERIAANFSDDSPAFLVHFPGQQQGIDIPGDTPASIEHDIIAALLQQKLSTPQSLVDFVHTAAPPALQTPPHP